MAEGGGQEMPGIWPGTAQPAEGISSDERSDKENMENQRDMLIERMVSEFGLLDKLRKSLTVIEIAEVKSKATIFEKNKRLLELIFENNKHQDLIRALTDTRQTHLVNWVRGNGEDRTEFGLDWPLRKREIEILDDNQENWTDLVDPCELLTLLFSKKVINKRQMNFIQSKRTTHEKNEELLNILRCCSLTAYFITIECLHVSNQDHIAEMLEGSGAVIHAHANLDADQLDEAETQIVREVTSLMLQSSENRTSLLLQELQMRIIAARRGSSIVLYIYCETMKELMYLCEIINTNEMKDKLEHIFNTLLHDMSTRVTDLYIVEAEINKAKKFFEREASHEKQFDDEISRLREQMRHEPMQERTPGDTSSDAEEKSSLLEQKEQPTAGSEEKMSSKRFHQLPGKEMMSARRNLRSSQRDTKEDEVTKKRRSVIVECFPHREAFQQDFKSDCCDARTLCVKSINYLENFQSRDVDHFWLDMSRSNYLTMLYFNCSNPSKLEEAMRQNEETLKRDPRNFNALWCRSELFLHQKKYPQVKDSLQRMEDLLEDSVQMVTAKAELGVCYPDFGPAFYQKSIRLLEEVLQELSSIPAIVQSDNLLASRTVKWTFDLIHTYNRLMNKGTIQTYWDNSTESCPKYEFLFKRIKELFEQVAASGDRQYTAEAWIELGDAYKKYEEKVPLKERAESLPDGKTVDDCFEMALELAPDDVFVLERCGRHYRQRATDISDFEIAVEFLKRCIERDPCRDVAYHHLGLAFRSMWLEMEKHDEARLHTNRTKKHGEKRSIQKMHRQKSLLSPNNGNQPLSFNQKTHNTKGSYVLNPTDAERGSEYTSVLYGRSKSYAGASFQNDNPIGVSAHLKPRLSVPATTKFVETIPPKYKKTESEVPKHYRKPDYYDKLRAGNPLAKDPQHKYLLEARRCFQIASDIRQGYCCRYLVDLARTYVSTRDLKEAWDLLVQADQSDYSSNDGAYLYEQWGLMAERQVDMEEDVEGDVNEHQGIEEVKNFYRQAIRYSAESKERSRVGFYRLRDIIYEQVQDNPSETCILQKEHLLLFKTIQDAKKAQEILENMKSEESIVLMWELVDLFYSRNRPEDSDAAFTYLALLADAKKLREPVDPEKDLEEVLLERITWVIEISERRVRRSAGRAQDTLSKTFEWLVTLSDGDILSDKKPKDSYVVCILAPSSDTPGVERVMSVLTGVIGVEVLQGFVEDSPDLPLGTSFMEEIENMVRCVRNAVVVMQMVGETMNAEELQMLHLLKPLVKHPDFATKRFCRAVTSESKAIEYDSLAVHLEWNLDEAGGKSGSESSDSAQLAFGFLRALFLCSGKA